MRHLVLLFGLLAATATLTAVEVNADQAPTINADNIQVSTT